MSKHEPSIARLYIKGERFEILVNPDLAIDYRSGKPISLDNVLITETIYKDAKKGERASSSTLQKIFGTTDSRVIADIILKRGEVPLTAEQKNKLIEEKRKQIISFISRNCIDPRTNAPIPPTRVEIALNEVRFHIDPFKDPEQQAMDVLKALKSIIPIKIAKALLGIKIPAIHASKAYNQLSKLGTVIKSSWQNDGSWIGEIEIPAGMQDSFIAKFNELTKGSGEIKILRVE
ncbi:MAG: ribosome assembly factor SBDS [Thermoprotei archaeon]